MKNGDMPAMPITAEPYPVGAIPTSGQVASGLTKREQFAMAAMQGLLASRETAYTKRTAPVYSKMAVEMADSLLAELEKSK